jgi:hypothetical protein
MRMTRQSSRVLAAKSIISIKCLCSALPFEKGRTPMLSAIPWITDSTIVQNLVIIVIVSILQHGSSYISLKPYKFTAE